MAGSVWSQVAKLRVLATLRCRRLAYRIRQKASEPFDLRTGGYEVQHHYERIRKSSFVTIAVYLSCNKDNLAANRNVGDVESDVGSNKLFIAPFFDSRNSMVLLPLVSEYSRFRKV